MVNCDELITLEEINIEPHNNEYSAMINELLAYEERNDVFNLTTRERAKFQTYVNERMDL